MALTAPSLESGVRQIVDVVPSDLVESVEINKTLRLPPVDGDAIGGSGEIRRTKTAGEQPTISLFGIGGHTPILQGRGVSQFGGTIGKRFGKEKKLGVLFGGTYDYNGRGINDPGARRPRLSSAISEVMPHSESSAAYYGTLPTEDIFANTATTAHAWDLKAASTTKSTTTQFCMREGYIRTSTTLAIAGLSLPPSTALLPRRCKADRSATCRPMYPSAGCR